ncbi:MAG TPA: hypothetical protein VIJ16_09405, partial [Gemmatimonadaceae bacterium]
GSGEEQQNWMADYADPAKLVPRAVPWTLPAIVAPMGGAKPARVRMWHTFGQEIGLYSSLPHFNSDGLSAPWSPQIGDDFQAIVADLKKRPPSDGLRGIAMVTPYGSAVDHPYAQPDGTPIPRAPTWMWGRHDGQLELLYADGHVYNAGQIPGVTHMHDWCVDEQNRKIIYACELGTPVSPGKFTGGKVVHVDRATGAGSIAGAEDATKYVVTDYLTGLIYPTGVCTDESSNVYVADFGTGNVYKNGAVWITIPGAFGIRYHAGSVYVLTDSISVQAVNCTTGVIGPNLFAGTPSTGAGFQAGSMFATISIDRNGTFGPAGNIAVSRSHGTNNIDVWIYEGGAVKTAHNTMGGDLGYMKVGDIIYTQDTYSHYPWAFSYHRWQGRVLSAGFTSHPKELVAYSTATEVPQEESDSITNGYSLGGMAMQAIRKGGSQSSPLNKPSLTCLMTREGWSPFAGCSSDEIAEMPFDAAEAWIKQGMIGSFRRDDLLPIEMFALLVFFYRQSQRYLIAGGALMTSLKAWWVGKYGPVPLLSSFPAGAYTPDAAQLLVPTLVNGVWTVVVWENGWPTTKAIPASYEILVDEGLPTSAPLSPGVTGAHALTAKAAGIAQLAIVMKV